MSFRVLDVSISAYFAGLILDKAQTQGFAKNGPVHREAFKWNITIAYQDRTYAGDYTAGLAHCTQSVQDWREKTKGQYGDRPHFTVHNKPEIARSLHPFGRLTLDKTEGIVYPTPPTVENYLECLQTDCRSGEHLLFEDFCAEFGYDTDSRSAEQIWRACQTTRGHMQKLFRDKFELFMEINHDEDERDPSRGAFDESRGVHDPEV